MEFGAEASCQIKVHFRAQGLVSDELLDNCNVAGAFIGNVVQFW